MKKTYPLIHNGFIYMVDEKEIPYNPNGGTNGLFICLSEIEGNKQHGVKLGDKQYISPLVKNVGKCQFCRTIIASNDKSLGLPLLPDIEKNLHDQMLDEYPDFIFLGSKEFNRMLEKFTKDKAKKYTEEDMRKAFEKGAKSMWDNKSSELVEDGLQNFFDKKLIWEDWLKLLQSLNPLPKFVEVEMDSGLGEHNGIIYGTHWFEPKVDKNNIIQVVKWTYE